MADLKIGTDGFPCCTKCGEQIRAANETYPGVCAECISKQPADDQPENRDDASRWNG